MIHNLIRNVINDMWPTLTITSVTLITVRFAYLKNHRSSFTFHQEFWYLVSILYMLLLYQLVTKVDYSLRGGFNIVPFTEIMRYDIKDQLFISNVLGNIILFIPFGYMISSYIKPKKMWTNMLIAIIVSATIEVVQLNIGRSFDIDDILLNTIGCIIGFLIYIGFKAIGNHLPEFLKSDWFQNLLCCLIIILMVIYILRFMGIVII